MNEDFVSFSLAKKLKEKGFRELCLAYYTNDDRLWFNHSHKADATYSDCYISHNLMPKGSVSGKFVDAPTIAQVLKWLREEKNLYVEVHISMRGGWYNMIYEISPRRGFDLKHMFIEEKSYEDAAIAGIEYCLDNLI